MNSFGAKILCRTHNSALHDIDSAGSEAMTSLEKFLQLRGVRRTERRRQHSVQRYAVNGLRLERWMLKAIIGLAFEYPTTDGSPWTPPLEWVELTFGRRSFADGCGLYVGRLNDARLELKRNRLGIQFLPRDGKWIGGAEFDLNGWRMTLSLVPLAAEGMVYRPKFMRDRDRLDTQQVVSFNWKTV